MSLLAPRWRKVIRDLWGNKSRTAVVVMAIAVGIFAIGVVAGSRETLTRVLNESYLATNPASGMAIVNGNFGDDFVETIVGMRAVETAEGRREIGLRYKLNPTDEWQELRLKVSDNFAESKIAKVWPQTGEWPPPDKKLVLERDSLAEIGVNIGDTLYVETANNNVRTMEIVGTALDHHVQPAALTSHATGYISRDTLEWLDESRDFNQLLYIVAEDKSDEAHIEAVGDLIEHKFNNEGITELVISIPTPGEHPVNDILEPLLLILTGLGALALALSGLLVANTISAMLAQQTRQIGMMKAIGARRSQIMMLYFVAVIIIGVLALVIALPLGAAGAYVLTFYLIDFFNTDLDYFSIPASVLAVQVAVGLLVPVLVAIYPIMVGTRVTVRAAISDYGVGQGHFGAGLIDRLLQNMRGLSRPMLISLRNTFRRKGRLTLTLLTLTLAGATFITIFSLRTSILATLDDLMATFGFDVLVVFEKEYRMVEIERATDQLPDIAQVENWGRATVNRIRPDDHKSDDITLEAPPPDTQMYRPQILEGRWLLPDDTTAVVINTDLLDNEPDLRVGDEVVLELEAEENTWRIVGLVQGTMTGATVYVNQPYFARLTHTIDKARAVKIATHAPATNNTRQLVQAFEQQFEQANLNVSHILTITEIQATVETSFDFLAGFLLSMALVLAAVGGLGLSGTMSMNVLERVREIGVMRAIGASDGAILKLVLAEGLLIGLLSWAASVILAWPISYLISYQLGVSLLGNPLTHQFSLTGPGLWLAITLVLAALASFFPARNASRLTVREVLAYE